MIDAGISTRLTSTFKNRISETFRSEHFAYVINTHAHHDHNRGNSVFNTARVVGHVNGVKEIDQQWEYPEKTKIALGKIVKEYDSTLQECRQNSEEWFDAFTQKTRYQYAYNDAVNAIPIKKPDIAFPDSLDIDMGDITFELKYFGQCHSRSDILIYVPELKLLFTGDLMFRYGRPSIVDKTMGEKDLWINAIRWIENRMDHIDLVIGGHGQQMSVDDLKSFNEKIREQIRTE